MNLFLFLVFALPEEKPKLIKEYDVIKTMQTEANKHRKQNGMGKLALNEECCIIAQRWANYMAQNNYFEHGGGEQIIGYGYSSSRSALNGWMNSGGHRAWVLSNSKLCGWGYQVSRDGTKYWVGVFRDKVPKVKKWNY